MNSYLNLADLCQASYDDDPRLTTVDDLAFIVDGDTICFRGSDNLHNWLRDFTIYTETTASGHPVHAGFLDAFKQLQPHVAPHIADATVFTGHSLGGAIAVLAAEAYGRRAVTFGCPRIWWYDEPAPKMDHDRVVCDDDPVPDMPLCFCHDHRATVTLPGGELPINPVDHCIGVYRERLLALSENATAQPAAGV